MTDEEAQVLEDVFTHTVTDRPGCDLFMSLQPVSSLLSTSNPAPLAFWWSLLLSQSQLPSTHYHGTLYFCTCVCNIPCWMLAFYVIWAIAITCQIQCRLWTVVGKVNVWVNPLVCIPHYITQPSFMHVPARCLWLLFFSMYSSKYFLSTPQNWRTLKNKITFLKETNKWLYIYCFKKGFIN